MLHSGTRTGACTSTCTCLANNFTRGRISIALPQSVRFEFYGITGKVYTIESTLDMKTWTRVPFSVGAPGTGSNGYQAAGVGIVSAFTAPRSRASEFFRLSVR